MADRELVEYIKEKYQLGAISKDEIEKILKSSGWSGFEINNAFKEAGQPVSTTQNIAPVPTPIVPPDSQQKQAESIPIVPPKNSVQLPETSSPPFWKKPKLLITVVIVVVILLIAGGAFGAYYYVAQSPERVLKKAIEKQQDITSAEFSGEIDMNFSGPLDGQLFKLKITFSGLEDMNDMENIKVSINMRFSSQTLPPLSGLGLDILTLDNTSFMRVLNVPKIGEPSIDPLLALFDRQWLRFDEESLAEIYEMSGTMDTPTIPTSYSEEFQQKIQNVMSSFDIETIFKIEERLSGETIEGHKTYLYKFSIDKDVLFGVVFEKIFEVLIEEQSNMMEKMFDENPEITDGMNAKEVEIENKKMMESFSEGFDEMLEELTSVVRSIDGELWIGKDDGMIYRVAASVAIQKTKDSPVEGDLSFLIDFKNFNNPVVIEAPELVKTLVEVFDADNDDLDYMSEMIYGTDPTKSDTDGDGYNDGEEVKNGYDPLGPGRL